MMCNIVVVFVFLVSVVCVQSHSISDANQESPFDKISTADITESVGSSADKEKILLSADRNKIPCDRSSGNEGCVNVTTTLAPQRAGKIGSSPHHGGRMPAGGAKDLSIEKEGPGIKSRTSEVTESKWDSGINGDRGKARQETSDVTNHESRKKQKSSGGGGPPGSGKKRGRRSVQAPPDLRIKSGDSGAKQEKFPVSRQKRDSGNGGKSKGDNPTKTSDNNRDDDEGDDNDDYDDFEDDDDSLQKEGPKGTHPRPGSGRRPKGGQAGCRPRGGGGDGGGGGGGDGGGGDGGDTEDGRMRQQWNKKQQKSQRNRKKPKQKTQGTDDNPTTVDPFDA